MAQKTGRGRLVVVAAAAEAPLGSAGRAGWRETGALKRVGLKLERDGMGRPVSDPES